MLEEIFKVLMPISTPLNLLLMGGLYWIARDRAKLLEALDVSHKELIVEKDKRADCLEKIYQEFLERGESMARIVVEFTQKAADVLARLDK